MGGVDRIAAAAFTTGSAAAARAAAGRDAPGRRGRTQMCRASMDRALAAVSGERRIVKMRTHEKRRAAGIEAAPQRLRRRSRARVAPGFGSCAAAGVRSGAETAARSAGGDCNLRLPSMCPR
jgi:hypothetical protein